MGRGLRVNLTHQVRLSPYIDQGRFVPCKQHQPVNPNGLYSGWRVLEDRLRQEVCVGLVDKKRRAGRGLLFHSEDHGQAGRILGSPAARSFS